MRGTGNTVCREKIEWGERYWSEVWETHEIQLPLHTHTDNNNYARFCHGFSTETRDRFRFYGSEVYKMCRGSSGSAINKKIHEKLLIQN